MTHPSVEDLQRLMAEDLLPDQKQSIEAHVNGCDFCLELMEAWQRLQPAEWDLLANMFLHPPGSDATVGSPDEAPRNGVAVPPPSTWPAFDGYELLDHVGSGGMGHVYKARQLRTNRIVALKTLPLATGSDTDETERLVRFRTEVEAVSRLQHPNIVVVYDVGEHEERPYFTMEWIGGGSLAEHLAGQPQAEKASAECLARLADAMHHAHRQGVIHRDLKPANVLLAGNTSPDSGDLVPKVGDFGVAKLLDKPGAPTRPNQWIGTPEYMAPEQVTEGATIGPAADIYALGVLLYEMLIGRPPLRSHEPLETMRQVRDEDPVVPRRLRPKLNRDLETICLKCLQKEPARRYPTAQALADDLRRWLAGETIQARPCGYTVRTVKWAKRHPERALLVALAVGLIVALGIGYLWLLGVSNARYARQLADSVDHQLLLIKYAVNQTAQDVELRQILGAPAIDPNRLRVYLEKTKQAFIRWFARPGEQPPIVNWFVMDLQGTILGDSYEDPKSVGRNYQFRDYFAGLMAQDQTGDQVYISRVYQSEQDDRHKFTVITRIGNGSHVCGLLGASVAVDARMVALDMRRELPGTRLVGPLDCHQRWQDPDPGVEAPTFVVVLHRDYAVAGQKPAPVTDKEAALLTKFTANPALSEVTNFLNSNAAYANYVRVGDSQFVVIAEHPYPWRLAWLAQRPWMLAAGVVSAIALLAILRRRSLARTKHSTIKIIP
jgi:serine/threonine-protein kinase